MLEDYVGLLLVAMVAVIVGISWLTIDQEEFNRNFERYRQTEEED